LIRQRVGAHYPLRQKRLYEGTGFPQAGQGKRGENYGESKSLVNIFVFCNLQCFKLERWVLVVWFRPKKCIFCTIAFWDHKLSNGTGAVEWTFRPGSSIKASGSLAGQ